MNHAMRVESPAPSKWRARVVAGLFVAAFVTLWFRALDLQVRDHAFLAGEGEKRHVRSLIEAAGRGAIRDRHGEPLAISAPVESIWAVPNAVLAAPEYVPALARLLETSEAGLKQRLESRRDRSFVYLERHMDPSRARRIKALGAPGVFLQREYRRYYPAGEVTSQLVGLTNIDGHGQEGAELAFDAMLRGTDGERRVIRDRLGRIIEDIDKSRDARAGEDVLLSIDLRLQYLAYRELKAAVTRHDARGGVVVMADPRTGELLAMASQPAFNPNRRDQIPAGGLRNRAATDTFEPGSTIKPLLIAEALESGLFSAVSAIPTGNGLLRVGKHVVKDSREYGDIDLQRILSRSSNVGAAMVGLQLGSERVWEGYRRFGLGEYTYTGFPGETSGVLRDFHDWNDVATATASYGYGISVTAMQLLRAYGALAADGRMRPLTLIKGATQEAAPVVSPETAALVRRMLQHVVSPEGTGAAAAVAGYRAAGKTGTVRKAVGGGYDDERHQAIFVGMLPVDRPRLVALVMIDEPGGDAYYGGEIAAPVFSRIMQSAARLSQVAPDRVDREPPLTAETDPVSEARS